jgi:hypothetical protein
LSFVPYIVISGLVAVLLLGVLLLTYLGVDAGMWRGISTGAAAGLVLFTFSWYTTLKGLKSKGRKDALGHMLGGFLVRLVVLTGGILTLALTGWGNPVGFALAFLMVLLVYLGLQVMIAVKNHAADLAKADLARTEATQAL